MASLRIAAVRLGALALGYGVTSGLRGLIMSVVENRLLARLRWQTFSLMLTQDMAFHDERDVGELTSRLNSDCEAVSSGLSLNFNIFLRNAVQLVFGVSYLAFTSWRLSLILVGVWAVLFYVYTVYGRFTRRASFLRQDQLAGLNIVATESLQNVRTLRSLGGEGALLRKYDQAAHKLVFLEHQRAAAYGVYATFYNGLSEGIKAVALGVGGLLCFRGTMTPEQLTATMLYVDLVVGSSLAVGGQYRQLMQSIGSSRRVFEYTEMTPSPSVVRQPGDDSSGSRRLPLDSFVGQVSFRNVSFTYPTRPGDPILRGLTLDVPAGVTTALVGASGSGKSTLASLLQRWYEPDGGEVLLDGVSLDELDPVWLRSLLGVVTQDPRLFSATVLENLVLGLGEDDTDGSETTGLLPNGSVDPAVVEAAKAAHAHEFIMNLPQGYLTPVGDARLSGGQRQRLALARALARRPRILVLDEATSALDTRTEAKVLDSIRDYLRSRRATCLVIAHRLSTVVDADNIVVIKNGRVVEQGVHQSLLRRNGAYSRLVRGAA